MAFHSYFVDVFLFSGFGYSNLLVNNLPCFMGTFRCWAQINKDNLGFPSVFVETCMSSILACNCKEGSFDREEREKIKNYFCLVVKQIS